MKEKYALFLFILALGACLEQESTTKKVNIANTLPKPSYWNQLEYDSLWHPVAQERYLKLNINPINQEVCKRQHFEHEFNWEYTAKLTINAKGKFSKKLSYVGSKIFLSFPKEVVQNGGLIDELYYKWYQPGKWFESLDLPLYNDSLQISYERNETEGYVDIVVNYLPQLKVEELYVSFGGTVGGSIDFHNKYNNDPWKKAWLVKKEKGHFVLRADILAFHTDFTAKYYRERKNMNIKVKVTFEVPSTEWTAVESTKKDPVYRPRKYGPRKFGRGNFHGDLPDYTPYCQMGIGASQSIALGPGDFPKAE